jgi:hypothetical protein
MPEKLTYEFVKNFIDNTGERLLNKTYKNSHEKIFVECNRCKNIYSMAFYNFKNHHRCPRCATEYKANKRRTKIDEIKKIVESRGYALISTEYGKDKKIIVKCPDKTHPEYTIDLASFKRGVKCRLCYDDEVSDRCRFTYSYIKNYIESVDGYKLLSKEYTTSNKKLEIFCEHGHTFKMRFNNFQQGQRCPIHSNSKMYSNGEKEVLEFVTSIYNKKIIENDRTTILNNLTNRYLELDIWFPDINVAIEYNGLYWHDNKYSQIKDNIKLEKCKNKGITLMIIMENEWKTDKEQIKEKIKKIIK